MDALPLIGCMVQAPEQGIPVASNNLKQMWPVHKKKFGVTSGP